MTWHLSHHKLWWQSQIWNWVLAAPKSAIFLEHSCPLAPSRFSPNWSLSCDPMSLSTEWVLVQSFFKLWPLFLWVEWGEDRIKGVEHAGSMTCEKVSLWEMARAADGKIKFWRALQNPSLKDPLMVMTNSSAYWMLPLSWGHMVPSSSTQQWRLITVPASQGGWKY